jgi:hypothetical protein
MKSYTELRDGLAQRSGRLWKPTCPSPSHSPRWPRGTTRKATRKMATGAKAKLRKPSRWSVISSQQPTCISVSSGRRLPVVRLKKKSYQLEDRVMEGYAMLNKKREAAEKAIKAACRAELKTIPFEIFHHPEQCNNWIQVADYCTWAVARKWERKDTRTYDQLRVRLHAPELDALRNGSTFYY